MPKPDPFSGMKLSQQPELGKGAIEQRLFQPTPTRQLVSESASQLAKRERSIRQAYPQRAYHLHQSVVTALEDMKTALNRKHGVKRPLIEEIVEVAVLQLQEDYEMNGEASQLVRKLASQRGNKLAS